MGIAWHEFPAFKPQLAETLLAEYRRIMEQTAPHRDDRNAGHIDYAWNLANVLSLKLELRQRLELAYESGNRDELKIIVEHRIPILLDAIDVLLEAFRKQWLRSFKSFGLELMQIRLGGLKERYLELARVIKSFICGESDSIPELEVKHQPNGTIPSAYHAIATGGFFI